MLEDTAGKREKEVFLNLFLLFLKDKAFLFSEGKFFSTMIKSAIPVIFLNKFTDLI
jgi:hypothetical protein